MRPIAVIGIIFIVIGILALAYQGFSYTTKEKVVDLGPLKVEAKREKTIPLPPVLGVLAVGAGVVDDGGVNRDGCLGAARPPIVRVEKEFGG